MLTYLYGCAACKKEFEHEQSITDAPLSDCDVCGAKSTVHRLISAGGGFALKGPGWYRDGYSGKNS